MKTTNDQWNYLIYSFSFIESLLYHHKEKQPTFPLSSFKLRGNFEIWNSVFIIDWNFYIDSVIDNNNNNNNSNVSSDFSNNVNNNDGSNGKFCRLFIDLFVTQIFAITADARLTADLNFLSLTIQFYTFWQQISQNSFDASMFAILNSCQIVTWFQPQTSDRHHRPGSAILFLMQCDS